MADGLISKLVKMVGFSSAGVAFLTDVCADSYNEVVFCAKN